MCKLLLSPSSCSVSAMATVFQKRIPTEEVACLMVDGGAEVAAREKRCKT